MDAAFTQNYWGKDILDDPRIHSDIFRVLLMRKTEHIWIDADVYALHPHQADSGYLFAPRKPRFIPNGVLRLPQDSPAVLAMEEFVSATGRIPPWWPQEKVDLIEQDEDKLSFEQLPVGVTGPEAFGHFIYQTGESKYGKPFSYLYPIAARHSVTLLQSPNPYDIEELRKNSMSLHLYATGIRRRLTRAGTGTPPPGCLLDELCAAHDIAVDAFPIEHRDSRGSARQARRHNRVTGGS